MGKKVVIKKITRDVMLQDGRLIQEDDISIIPALFGIAGVKVTTPEDALIAAKVRNKIVLLSNDPGVDKDLILEDAEFNYLNNLIDPKSGSYNADLIMSSGIAPLIEMFRDATDIKLKEDGKKGTDKDN